MNEDRYEGKECIYGHGRIRYKKSHICVECKRLQNKIRNDKNTILAGNKVKINHGVSNYYYRWTTEDIDFATTKDKDGSYSWSVEEVADALNRTPVSIKHVRKKRSKELSVVKSTKEPEQMKKEVIKKIYFRLGLGLMKEYPELEGSTEGDPIRGMAKYNLTNTAEIYTKLFGCKVSSKTVSDAFEQLGIQQLRSSSNQSKSEEIQELRDAIIRLESALLHLSKDTNKEDRVRDLLTPGRE